ncbi:MAG: hypothetical protein AAGJ93_11460 [Bacteroidota bacterium]
MRVPPNPKKDNISGVFNYCSRWCERCPFTDRCANFQMLDGMDEIEEDDTLAVDQVMPQLPIHLNQVISNLKTQSEKAGYDWESIHCDLHKYQPRPGELARKELAPAARNFTFQLFRLSDMMEEQSIPESWKNPINVLRWYGTLLSGKVNRAVDEEFLDGPDTKENPTVSIQSDENGTAKLALLAIVRCLGAVSVMLREPAAYEEELITLILDLLRLQQGMRQYFPQADQFERPGFDDPAYHADMEAYYDGYLPIDPFRDGPWVVQGFRASEA